MTIRDTISAALLKALEEGRADSSSRGFLLDAGAGYGLPENFTTGQHYRRSNVLLLWDAMRRNGYARNQWLTYNQARLLGAQVRAGSTGVMCVMVTSGTATRVATEDETGSEALPSVRNYRTMRPFWLFNVAQIDGLPALPHGRSGVGRQIDSLILSVARQGARIRYGYDEATYNEAEDVCQLPAKASFTSSPRYYRAVFHTLARWTGRVGRLNREFGGENPSEGMALESLVADLASAFCCARLGLSDAVLEFSQSRAAQYFEVLRQEPLRQFSIVAEADAAYRYLMELAGLESPQVARVSSSDDEGYEVLA